VVTYRVQVKDPRYLHSLIIEKYGSIKQLSIDSKMSESTLHRILKSGRLSYYAASRLGQMLDANFTDLFEIINVKE
jgi:AraC-like DNA-binding protein